VRKVSAKALRPGMMGGERCRRRPACLRLWLDSAQCADNKDWVFETKWDGFRLVAKIEDRSVTLYSRSTSSSATTTSRSDAVIDGELVVLDEHGVSRFQLLQNALNTTAHLHYCVFDVMFLDGEDFRSLPLVERKKRLKALLPKDPLLIYGERWPEQGG
jgi:bifunctional non-homologous end joining protein LigD